MTSQAQQPAAGGDVASFRYDARLANAIETRWQTWWDQHQTFRAPNPGDEDFDASRPKFYCLDMFPYPSGAGLHVGHPEGYTATDIICRYKRMKGFNVLHPMGWDAFGLPAEQYAIQTGVHPAVTTRKAIDNFRRQLKRFGFSYDWSRELGTIDPDYYRWTQWIFLQLYHAWFDPAQRKARHIHELVEEFASGTREVLLNPHAAEYAGAGDLPGGTRVGAWSEIDEDTQRMIVDSYRLAYVARQTVNWCPKLGTALANEEVIDGKSERGGYPVFRKPMRQWMFRITAYADRLLEGLDDVDWPESTKTLQANWIGRSEGAEIDFPIVLGGPPLRGGSSTALSGPPLRGGSSPSLAYHSPAADPALALRVVRERGSLNPAGFVPRDPYPEGEIGAVADLVRTDRSLPHLRLPRATYFITWRATAGQVFDGAERQIILDALLHFDDSRCRVYAAVVMPDHVHWIVRPFDGISLDELVTSVKRFTASRVNQSRGSRGHVWQSEQFDHIIRDGMYFAEFVEYILQNPVRAEEAESATAYPWLFVHKDALGETAPARGSAPTAIEPARGERAVPEPAPEGRATPELTGLAIRVFTTRPDTIFGATYMVVAPEHPLVDEALDDPRPETDAEALRTYVQQARNRSDVERQESKDKTGVFTGLYALNPATGKPIPVWTSDYVLMGYGTGAIMAVPAQDQRDWDFAAAFDLPIVRTVQPPEGFDGEAFTGDGPAINSEFLDGLRVAEAKQRIIAWLEQQGAGQRRVNYRLRDWLFSRQRYWGEPFPIVWDQRGRHHPVAETALPVTLPDMADYAPEASEDPQPLLAKATDWVGATAGEAGAVGLDPDTPVQRETNTMPGWAGSCWYYLRYCDPKNSERLVADEAERYWMRNGVDLYIGGAEHAVLHLLYARFWHKALHDLGHVSTDEPFKKLFHQGLITSHAYQRADKSLVPIDEVDADEQGGAVERATGQKVTQIVAKMSKSLKNVVNPDEVIARFGADTFRLYEMYMGPLEQSKPWNTNDTIGLYRFLQRAWRLAVDEDSGELRLRESADDAVEKQLHRAIAKVGADIEKLAFNTAIAAMIEFVNAATSAGGLTRDQLDRFCRILSPFAPHMGEELWHRLGHETSVAHAPWPDHDEAMLRDDEVEIVVQILGKVRAKLTVPADADADTLQQIALADPKVQALIEGKTVRKVIAVPGRLVNIVAN